MVMKLIGVLIMILMIHLLNNWLTPESGVNFAIFGLLGGLFSGMSNAIMAEETNRQNRQLVKETNELNYKINQENNAFNRNLAIEMFNLENKYNNPAAQMSRLQNAGINPFVAAGQVGNVEGRVDTVPAQNPIPMQAPQNMPVRLDFAENFAGIAQGLAAIAQAKKSGIETSYLEKTFDDMAASLKNEVQLKSLDVQQKTWDYNMSLLYGEKRIRKEIQVIQDNHEKLQQDITESDARICRMDIQNALDDIERKLKGTEFEKFQLIRPWISKIAEQDYNNKVKEGEVLDTQADANRASARASDAAARESNARTETENQMRKWKVEFEKFLSVQKEYESGLTITDWKKAQATYNKALERVDLENDLTRQTVELVNQQINKAILEQDWYVVFGLMNSAAGMLNALKK